MRVKSSHKDYPPPHPMLRTDLCSLQQKIAKIAMIELIASGEDISTDNLHRRTEELVYASTKWIIETHKAASLGAGHVPS